MDSYNLRENRASSNFDERHLLSVNYIYQLPLKNCSAILPIGRKSALRRNPLPARILTASIDGLTAGNSPV